MRKRFGWLPVLTGLVWAALLGRTHSRKQFQSFAAILRELTRYSGWA